MRARILPLALLALLTLLAPALRAAETEITLARIRQARLKTAFEDFRRRLTVIANRLEAGSPDDRARAENVRKALQVIAEANTDAKFDALIASLGKSDAGGIDALGAAVREFKELRDDLASLIKLLTEDDGRRHAKTVADLKQLLADLKDLRERQIRLQAMSEDPRHDPKKLADLQKSLEAKTRDIAAKADPKLRAKIEKSLAKAAAKQAKAADELQKAKRADADKSQGEAASALGEAIRDLEEQLTQAREEERIEKLKSLIARTRRILHTQEGINSAAATLARDIVGTPTLPQRSRSNDLADRELPVVKETKALIDIVATNPNGAAFAEAYGEVLRDAEILRERFGRAEFGEVTKTMQDDIVASLKEIIKALEKAMDTPAPTDDSPPQPPTDGPAPELPLIDATQELKMVRGLQTRIADRTAVYARQYPGEQVPDVRGMPEGPAKESLSRVVREMADLSGRQARVAKLTKAIVTRPAAR